MAQWSEEACLASARILGAAVKESLLACAEIRFNRSTDYKASSAADEVAVSSVVASARRHNMPVVIRVEGHGTVYRPPEPVGSFLVDPLDGTLNHALGVGDPGFVLAWTPSLKPVFADVTGGFVAGLRSDDVYYCQGRRVFYAPAGVAAEPIQCDTRIRRLEEAVVYANLGYGPDCFAAARRRSIDCIMSRARHVCAFDNAGLEIAQMCRGAAHLRVEARSFERDGKLRGSEHANILAAFALGPGAGLVVSDLKGRSLDAERVELDRVQDFLCASHPALRDQAVALLAGDR